MFWNATTENLSDWERPATIYEQVTQFMRQRSTPTRVILSVFPSQIHQNGGAMARSPATDSIYIGNRKGPFLNVNTELQEQRFDIDVPVRISNSGNGPNPFRELIALLERLPL